jgi:hypothetical protein
MDIFSMILGKAIDWGIGKILDVTTSCLKCGQRDAKNIANVSNNTIECSNCHIVLNQFTNACNFTLNQQTREIGQGVIWTPNVDYSWEKLDRQPINLYEKLTSSINKNGLYDVQNTLFIDYSMRSVGLLGQHLVVNIVISDFNTNQIITSWQDLMVAPYYDCTFNNRYFGFAKNSLPQLNHQILAIDLMILSKHREVVAQQRRLIKPFY